MYAIRIPWEGRATDQWSGTSGQLENGRRVVANVELHVGELFLRVSFIVTNLN